MMSALIHASSAIPYQITRMILKNNKDVKEIPADTAASFSASNSIRQMQP